MAKYKHPSKLPKKEQEEILFEFSQALSEIKNPLEAMRFIKDLLSPQEAEMLAKRVKIAEYLLDGYTYDQVMKYLKTSTGTIARVNEWLKYSGDGYRMLIDRLKQKRKHPAKKTELNDWTKLRRRYPVMYWPQILLEEFARSANKKQRERMREAIEQMDEKSEIYKRIDKALKESGRMQ